MTCTYCGAMSEITHTPQEVLDNPQLLKDIVQWGVTHDQECSENPLVRRLNAVRSALATGDIEAARRAVE